MHRRVFLVSGPATVALTLSACANVAGAQTDMVTDAPAEQQVTQAAVAASRTFLDTLSAAQRQQVTYDAADPALRSWFYFPSRRDRSGIALGALDSNQQAAAFRVAAAILSAEGYRQFRGIIAAEQELGRRNNDPQVNAGRYFIAFFGTPSLTERFTVQINGHHLAINTTFENGQVSPTPAFTGVDPVEIDMDGVSTRPMQAKSDAYSALLASLSAAERDAARIGPVDDVRVGTGATETYPRAEGVLVTDLGALALSRIVDVVRAWVSDAPAPVAARLLELYQADFANTRLAWTGSDDPDTRGAYLRLDGPRLWIEFSNVGRFGNGDNHYHSVFRDKQSDYLANA